MDAFTTTVPRQIEDVVLPPVNEDGGTGSSRSISSPNSHPQTTPTSLSRSLSPELGGNRTFLVHLPAAYSPSTPGPHALKQERITGLSEVGVLIDGKGIVAVYPEGQFGPGKNGNESIRAWQGAPYSPPGVDDLAFTQELLSHLSDNLCLDSNRLHASGKSNGGGFTNLLACTPQTANLFAAFASVSPALYAGANPIDCAPGPPVPRTHRQLPRVIGSYYPTRPAGALKPCLL